jgi:choline dehydrogenase-like flavoprotein
MYDVIVVGAGPAGLSAALMLGRSRRRVLVCDSGKPRNAVSRAMHGYLTRDGIPPREFLRIARQQLQEYDCVELRDVEVTAAECRGGNRFLVTLGTGEEFQSRKLLIATGVVDNVPQIPGFLELFGSSVFHCPYCDGWEVRDQPLAIYGRGARGYGLSLELTASARTASPDSMAATGYSNASFSNPAIRWRGARCSSPPARLSDRSSPLDWAASSMTRGRSAPGSTSRRTSQDSTLRATRRGQCSGSSSPPPKGRRRRLRSTPTCSGRTWCRAGLGQANSGHWTARCPWKSPSHHNWT